MIAIPNVTWMVTLGGIAPGGIVTPTSSTLMLLPRSSQVNILTTLLNGIVCSGLKASYFPIREEYTGKL